MPLFKYFYVFSFNKFSFIILLQILNFDDIQSENFKESE